MEVRAARVTLSPRHLPDRKRPAVTVNVVLVREIDPPPGETRVEWVLITTMPIDTPEQVKVIVEDPCSRCGIEILFRALKSGCRVEERRLQEIERVLPFLAVFLNVAWRTRFVGRLGRGGPDPDCEVIFEPSEWKAVRSVAKRASPSEEGAETFGRRAYGGELGRSYRATQ